MPFPIELAALGAPVLVALSNLVASPSAARLGAAGFNLLRLVVAVAGMGVLVLIVGPDRALSAAELGVLAFSALIGLVLGDTAIYAALARIGARRTGLASSAASLVASPACQAHCPPFGQRCAAGARMSGAACSKPSTSRSSLLLP